ncbi:hypothetical protein Plhal304r1_c078g0164721 [Plasmopara halstedii]
MNKFCTYLKQFTNSKPKSFFRTSIYDSKTAESGLNGFVHTESQSQYRVEREPLCISTIKGGVR